MASWRKRSEPLKTYTRRYDETTYSLVQFNCENKGSHVFSGLKCDIVFVMVYLLQIGGPVVRMTLCGRALRRRGVKFATEDGDHRQRIVFVTENPKRSTAGCV